MAPDFTSIFWDVLDSHQYFSILKRAAIGDDSSGLPERQTLPLPVNRHLQFDDDEQSGDYGSGDEPSDHSVASELSGSEPPASYFQALRFFLYKLASVLCKAMRYILPFFLLVFFVVYASRQNKKGWTDLRDTFIDPNLNRSNPSHESGREKPSHLAEVKQTPPHRKPNPTQDPPSQPGSCGASAQALESLKGELVQSERSVATIKIALEARIAQLETTEKQNTEKLRELQGALEKSREDASALEDKIASLKSEVAAKVDENKEGSGQTVVEAVESLSVEVKGHKNELSAVHKDLIQLQRQVHDREKEDQENEERSAAAAFDRDRVVEVFNELQDQKAGRADWIRYVDDSSKSFHRESSWSLFGHDVNLTPLNTLKDSLSKGSCWAFAGSEGWIKYMLYAPVLVDEVTLVHLHKSRRVVPGSVPKRFKVEGSADEGSSWLDLGTYTYDQDGPAVQRFAVPQMSEGVDKVKFTFLTNYGQETYTTVYKVEVHGTRS